LVEAATALTQLTTCVNGLDKAKSASKESANTSNTSSRRTLVSDEEDSQKANPSQSLKSSRLSTATRGTFPERLLKTLNDTSLSDIVTWLPHGRSFVIIRPDVLTEKVLPKYFPPVDARGSTKYPSFTRKLNRWGFRQQTRGPDTGAFHHPLFRRDQPELCLEMECQRSRDRGALNKKSAASQKKRSNSAAVGQNGYTNQRQQQQQTSKKSPRVRSPQVPLQGASASIVSDDTRSVASSSNASTSSRHGTKPSHSAVPCQERITADKVLVQAALRRRDSDERIKVAKIMLYHSYLKAL